MSIELLSFFVARRCTRSCCFIEETEFVSGLEEVSHGLTVVGSKGAMELSKRKGKAVCVAKGKETVAHQVLDGDLEKIVKFLREKNVGIVICDELELNQAHKVTTSRAEQDAVLEARKTSTRQPGSINKPQKQFLMNQLTMMRWLN
ncbi:uncharacterized protein LOC131304309 [Rhododendron vialii]|uniref:uncharacterized protein LOC131304309 n=1 Tax=Rhododendron vialii TaxID=182163 RepID=UPI00265DAA60|nr:uncharacterized protein LOC131304309 [Rhododendron vialii]